MKKENDQHSSSLRSNQPNRKFEILRAEIILFSPKKSFQDSLGGDRENIFFSSDKILKFEISRTLPKRHLRLVCDEDCSVDNVLKFQ